MEWHNGTFGTFLEGLTMLPVYCVDSFFGKNSFEKKSSSLQNEMGAFLRKVFAKWVDIFSHFEEKLGKKGVLFNFSFM